MSSPYCIEDDCKYRAYYNYPNNDEPEYCKTHQKTGMICFQNGYCRGFNEYNEQCQTLPSYGKIGTTKTTYCKDCYSRLDNEMKNQYTNVVGKRCIKCQKKKPYFNKPVETNGLYCGDCKDDDMVDVVSKKCIKCQKKRPKFNKSGETNGLYCGDCKDADMVDVVNKKCIKCKSKQPYFNKPGEKNGLYCGDCKDDDMVDVVHKKCIKCQNKRPYLNKPGEKNGLYCGDCKDDDMVDVVSKKCIKCQDKRPTYNKPWEKNGLYCGDCKDADMVDVVNKKCIKCQNKRPYLNKPGEKNGLYCGDCKDADMVDVVSKRCLTPLCDTFVSKKYRGYCTRCFLHMFPDEPISRNYKTKERTVVEFITTTFPEYRIINDRVISGGCSKKRPDVLIDVVTHCVIVEIDEHEHINYNCESKRMMEISQDLGHPNIVFIRFNPDSYTDIDGNKIKSCWKVNKQGICVVNDVTKWNERLDTLRKQVEHWLHNIPDKHITEVNLYYTEC
jgi:hypothetical protein